MAVNRDEFAFVCSASQKKWFYISYNMGVRKAQKLHHELHWGFKTFTLNKYSNNSQLVQIYLEVGSLFSHSVEPDV